MRRNIKVNKISTTTVNWNHIINFWNLSKSLTCPHELLKGLVGYSGMPTQPLGVIPSFTTTSRQPTRKQIRWYQSAQISVQEKEKWSTMMLSRILSLLSPVHHTRITIVCPTARRRIWTCSHVGHSQDPAVCGPVTAHHADHIQPSPESPLPSHLYLLFFFFDLLICFIYTPESSSSLFFFSHSKTFKTVVIMRHL